MKKILLFVLILCATVTAFAQSFIYNDLYYNVTGRTTVEVVMAYGGAKGAITIPSTLKNDGVTYTVTRIGYDAFKCNFYLTSITIPKTVTSIAGGAFVNCHSLTSISIDWDLPLAINKSLFQFSDSRATLYVPKGTQAAYKSDPVWKNFGNIVEGTMPQTFIVSGINYIVTSPTTVSVGYNPKIIGEVVIPSNVTDAGTTYTVTGIHYKAFSYSTLLTSLVIPKSVTSIGYNAFEYCARLNFLTIDCDTPLSINAEVFDNVPLASIYLFVPKGKVSAYKATPIWRDFGNIAEGVEPLTFSVSGINYKVTSSATVAVALNSNFIGSAKIPNTVTHLGINYLVSSISRNAFENCSTLSDVTIPNTVKTIGNNSFLNCRILKSVIIPNSVSSIGNSAFSFCKALTSIIIPNSVQSIGDNAFEYCSSLTTANIGDSLKNIGTSAFSSCSGLTSLNLPNSVTSIGAYAFKYCYGLKSINIPNSLTSIEKGTFARCDSLSSIIIPNSVINIEDEAFANCLSLSSINISNSVSSISNLAFYGCTGLTSLNLPNSLTFIGDAAFGNCTNLKSVTVNWTSVLSINESVFEILFYSITPPNATLHVPIGTLAAYKATAVWQDFNPISEDVLPLTLTSLTAKSIAIGNQINWATANIVNVKNIILERSGADNSFSYLTTLPITATQFIDFNPLASDNYYRLSTIDNDGSTKTYPQIAFVNGLTNNVSFYPNPITNGVLNVVAGDAKLQSVALYDLNGKRVVLVNSFNNTKNVAVNTQGLEKGVYLLEIGSDKSKLVKKVVVN